MATQSMKTINISAELYCFKIKAFYRKEISLSL